ncbi:hypothetical protein CO651_23295 [Rhizobium phaseoli]|nr:hypothetical protein RHECNPAF_710036 [Rhizobium etli CNPAF512]PCD65618.1 hypothetical protein CO648_22225 [Rhizobium phaseoli]PDS29185.1 hypothetical protein CO650_22155 [Rhizobium phaseoli]PDS69505.1 hypothetical protein CO651_23295 [Rhizobium phaseoli]
MTAFPRALPRLCITLAGVRNDLPIELYNRLIHLLEGNLRQWVFWTATNCEVQSTEAWLTRRYYFSFCERRSDASTLNG